MSTRKTNIRTGVTVTDSYTAQLEQKIKRLEAELQAKKDKATPVEIIELSSIASVQEFHQVMGLTIDEFEPSLKTIALRINLIFEELTELAESLGDGGVNQLYALCHSFVKEYKQRKKDPKLVRGYDPIEALDALVDLRYVLDGTTVSLGLQSKFADAFDIVQVSNLSKVCFTEYDRDATVKRYEEDGVEVGIRETTFNGKPAWVVYRVEDGKILKCVDYIPVDFTRLFEDNTNEQE